MIVPDKDADGLSAGAIIQKTLVLLGMDPDLISVHLVRKGSNIHEESGRAAMTAQRPEYIFVLDQGSRKSPPLIYTRHKAMVIDHHWALEDDFPEGSEHVTACDCPPVATSSLLAYHICNELHDQVKLNCDWLCVMGTQGDLGNKLNWRPPFPDMDATFKTHTKKAINEAVSRIAAPRRTAAFNIHAAWAALTAADSPADVVKDSSLTAARAEINRELGRFAWATPRFSGDGKIAILRINSATQIHPVIATKWAAYLQSPLLEVVIAANDGYLPGMVSFSCRISRSARVRHPPVNIIEVLQGIAAKVPDPTLRERLCESFTKGHKEASGGSVPKAEFEEFVEILEIGKRPEGDNAKDKNDAASDPFHTLTSYFGEQNTT